VIVGALGLYAPVVPLLLLVPPLPCRSVGPWSTLRLAPRTRHPLVVSRINLDAYSTADMTEEVSNLLAGMFRVLGFVAIGFCPGQYVFMGGESAALAAQSPGVVDDGPELSVGVITGPAATEDGFGGTDGWYEGALDPGKSPIDLSWLNDGERPAGRRGFIQAKGDQLVFSDGSVGRFWGGNLAARALFADRDQIKQHARRIAELGFNLMRLHHHDSTRWVRPTVIDRSRSDSQHLNAQAMDRIDWWIKCLKDEGVYTWLDLHVGRQFKADDGLGETLEEIQSARGEVKGFCYVNPRVQQLMKGFNAAYLNHVNRYTGLAYKNDPGIIGLLITNENDVTDHFGNRMLPDKGNPVHQGRFEAQIRDFCQRTGLPARKVRRTWKPGLGKVFLNDLEHRFNQTMIEHLRELGVRVPIATTSTWGSMPLYSLPALTDGDVIDAHAYGQSGVSGVSGGLSANPRLKANYITWIAGAQVYGKPLTVTEWNVPYPAMDRFAGPMYVMSIASLQGWDAPMIYCYSGQPFNPKRRLNRWSTYSDPAITGVMPAAAIGFRQGHIAQAKKTYCLKLNADQLYHQKITAKNSATIRTLAEQSKVTIGLPDEPSLTWDAATVVGGDVTVLTDANLDFLSHRQGSVVSDTGELKRDWVHGIHTIDTPRTQSVSGKIGGHAVHTKDVGFYIDTDLAVVVVTSLDSRPILESSRILITAIGRAIPGANDIPPFRSEPITGKVVIRSIRKGLSLYPLESDGERMKAVPITYDDEGYEITVPTKQGSHWYVLDRTES